MSDQDQDEWIVAAARLQTRPRLGQSGPLTGQQYFVGRKLVEALTGRPLPAGLRAGQGEPV